MGNSKKYKVRQSQGYATLNGRATNLYVRLDGKNVPVQGFEVGDKITASQARRVEASAPTPQAEAPEPEASEETAEQATEQSE